MNFDPAILIGKSIFHYPKNWILISFLTISLNFFHIISGTFYIVNAIDFTNFFRVASGSKVGDCLITCLTSSDCQYTAFLPGTGCLIGNFANSQTSFPQPSSISAYIIIGKMLIISKIPIKMKIMLSIYNFRYNWCAKLSRSKIF